MFSSLVGSNFNNFNVGQQTNVLSLNAQGNSVCIINGKQVFSEKQKLTKLKVEVTAVDETGQNVNYINIVERL